MRDRSARLAPEVNRILYVRNLPFKITAEEMYHIFGKYGPLRQVRIGDAKNTKGTAFVVYEDIYDAKNAVESLRGFNVCGRYLIVLYYQAKKMQRRKPLGATTVSVTAASAASTEK
jgi:pre-mRNA branch site protein p14